MVRLVRNSWWPALAAAVVVAAIGCRNEPRHGRGGSGGKSGEDSQASGGTAAEQLLEQMFAVYARADSYADRGELVMQFQKDGKPHVAREPFSVMFVRPNKLRMHLYQATYICDGRYAWGWTSDLPGYILKRPAPPALTLGEVYADEVLATMLKGQLGSSLQLAMMLGTDTMELVRSDGGERPELMSDDYIDSFACRRVRVRRPDGNMIYWIDRDNLLLRRIEFPTGRLPREMMGVMSQADLRLSAEFVDPLLNSQISDDPFDFQPPPQVKIVDRLEAEAAVDLPRPPSSTLGKKAEDFTLTTLDGRTISTTSTGGKTAVFVFWSYENQQSLYALGDINEAFKKLRARNDVVFVSVNIDPVGEQGIKDKVLTDAFATGKIELPIARDASQQLLKIFDVNFVPTLLIVGPNGTVQYSEVGLSPQLESKCAALVERAAAGESLVETAHGAYRERMQKYEQSQKPSTSPADPNSLPKTQIAAAGAPKNLKLATLWKSTELKQPGYVLSFDESSGSRVLVADGLRSVAELDGEGRAVRRVDLDLPKEPEAVISYWRTATDAAGKRYFVGSAGAQQQLHLFDREFKKILSFPEGSHPGISDIELGDLDGDGTPEILVGYWETIGVQAVGLDGTRKWSNRRLPENVLRLAPSGKLPDGKRMLLATTGRMDVAILDSAGALLQEMPVGDRAARLVASADLDGDGGVELAAITATGPGTDVMVGINGAGSVTWSYPLPAGVQPVPEMQNEMLVGGRALEDGTGAWVVAGADGSIHILGGDGKPLDSWAWGEAIRGINLATIGGKPALVVSDAKGVTAVRLSK